MKKIFLILFFIIFLIGLIFSYNYFNTLNPVNYLPDDSKVVFKINNFKDLLKLDIENINNKQLKKLKNNFLVKLFSFKDFYLSIDSDNRYYLYTELSFFTRFFDKIGLTKSNLLCLTNNKSYKFEKTNFYNENNLKKPFSKKEDILYFVKMKKIYPHELLQNINIFGTIKYINKNNLVKIDYKIPNNYIDIKCKDNKINMKKIPDRFDFYIDGNINKLEKHYLQFKRYISKSKIYKKYFQKKNNLFINTGVDFENDFVDILNGRFFIGLKNKNLFGIIQGIDKNRIEEIENRLKMRYPVDFENRSYNDLKYKTMEIRGLAGFLALNLYTDRIIKLKKPFYYVESDNLYFFDNYEFMRIYTDENNNYNLGNDKNYNLYKKYIDKNKNNLLIFINKRYINKIKNQIVKDYVKYLFINSDFNENKINGSLLIKLKTLEGESL